MICNRFINLLGDLSQWVMLVGWVTLARTPVEMLSVSLKLISLISGNYDLLRVKAVQGECQADGVMSSSHSCDRLPIIIGYFINVLPFFLSVFLFVFLSIFLSPFLPFSLSLTHSLTHSLSLSVFQT